MPRNPNDILCGGMPDLGRFRSFAAIVLHDKDLQKCITTNVYNIYRFVGHIQQSIRTNIIGQFDRDIESTRIKLIIGRITEEQFKETLIWYKENLERIYCFKYPSNYLPKCLLNKIKDEKKENNLFNRYSMRDIFIYKKENDNCDILDYSYKNYNKK
jgi:hypothetical protein